MDFLKVFSLLQIDFNVVIIWGNHSETMVPDISHTKVYIKNKCIVGNKKICHFFLKDGNKNKCTFIKKEEK